MKSVKAIVGDNNPNENGEKQGEYLELWMEERDRIVKEKDKEIHNLKYLNQKSMMQLKAMNKQLDTALSKAKFKPNNYDEKQDRDNIKMNKDREIAAQTKMLENLHKDVEAMKQKLAIPSSLERIKKMQEILEEKKAKGINLQKQIKSLQREQKRNEHTIVTKFKDTPDVPQDKLKIALNNIPKEEANIANIEKAIQQEKSLIEQKEKLNEDMEAKCIEKEKEITSIKTSQPLSKEQCNTYKKQIEDKCGEIEKEKKKSEELKQFIDDLDRKHEEEVKKLKDKIKVQETQLDIASTDFNISDHKLKEIKNIILSQKFKDIQKKKALKKVKASQEGQTKEMVDAIQNAGSIPDSKNPSILNSLNHTQNKEKTKNINAHPVSVMNTHLTEQIKDKDAAVFDLTKVDKGI